MTASTITTSTNNDQHGVVASPIPIYADRFAHDLAFCLTNLPGKTDTGPRDQRFRIGLKQFRVAGGPTPSCPRDQRFRIGLKLGLGPDVAEDGGPRDQRFRIGLKHADEAGGHGRG